MDVDSACLSISIAVAGNSKLSVADDKVRSETALSITTGVVGLPRMLCDKAAAALLWARANSSFFSIRKFCSSSSCSGDFSAAASCSSKARRLSTSASSSSIKPPTAVDDESGVETDGCLFDGSGVETDDRDIKTEGRTLDDADPVDDELDDGVVMEEGASFVDCLACGVPEDDANCGDPEDDVALLGVAAMLAERARMVEGRGERGTPPDVAVDVFSVAEVAETVDDLLGVTTALSPP